MSNSKLKKGDFIITQKDLEDFNKGEVYETILCNEMSPEYKNSLPKSLTLIRNAKDGTGFIATYKQV